MECGCSLVGQGYGLACGELTLGRDGNRDRFAPIPDVQGDFVLSRKRTSIEATDRKRRIGSERL